MAKFWTVEELSQAAGTLIFMRGMEYFEAQSVSRLDETNGEVSAVVAGNERYRVSLKRVGDTLDLFCTCPHHADGNFCKHGVATGLAWIEKTKGYVKSEKRIKNTECQENPWDSIKGFLKSASSSLLSEILLKVARRDDALYRELLLMSESSKGRGISSFKTQVNELTDLDTFYCYDNVREWKKEMDVLFEGLSVLALSEKFEDFVKTCAYLIDKVSMLSNSVDAFDYRDVLSPLEDCLLASVKISAPSPEMLGRNVFRLMVKQSGVLSFENFISSASSESLVAFTTAAKTAWGKISVRLKDENQDMPYIANEYADNLQHILLRVAKYQRDEVLLVDVLSKTLSSPYHYTHIVQELLAIGCKKSALEWVEHGLKSFPIEDFASKDILVLCDVLKDGGQKPKALYVLEKRFSSKPEVAVYANLRDLAVELESPSSIQNAWNMLNSRKGKTKQFEVSSNLRLSCAIVDKDVEKAWNIAETEKCSRQELLSLATMVKNMDENKAFSIYKRVVPMIFANGATGDVFYKEAMYVIRSASYLLKMKEEFSLWVSDLLTQYSRKRNFVSMLQKLKTS